jgi:hypothetical protein
MRPWTVRALSAGASAVTIAIAIACSSGSKVSGDPGNSIDPNRVVVATRPCEAGYEHAVVCCHGTNCVTYETAPFQACDGTSYPDGQRCCSLSDPSSCTRCDPKTTNCGTFGGGTLFGAPTGGCDHCPPGYTGNGPTKGGCCRGSSGGSFCTGSGGVCAGPRCPPTAPCAPVCAPGFALSKAQVDVCCRDREDGQDCYVWLPADPNAMSCGTAGLTCGCSASIDGHTYQMDCDSDAGRCTCRVDGTLHASLDDAGPTCDGGTSAAWKTCGFP